MSPIQETNVTRSRMRRIDILNILRPYLYLLGDTIAMLVAVRGDDDQFGTRLKLVDTGERCWNIWRILPAQHMRPEDHIRTLGRQSAFRKPADIVARHDWDALFVETDRHWCDVQIDLRHDQAHRLRWLDLASRHGGRCWWRNLRLRAQVVRWLMSLAGVGVCRNHGRRWYDGRGSGLAGVQVGDGVGWIMISGVLVTGASCASTPAPK